MVIRIPLTSETKEGLLEPSGSYQENIKQRLQTDSLNNLNIGIGNLDRLILVFKTLVMVYRDIG